MTSDEQDRLALVFGARLREVRRDRGWSQDRLAQRSGLGRTTVNRLESGRSGGMPRLCTLWRLARALEMTVSDLLLGVE